MTRPRHSNTISLERQLWPQPTGVEVRFRAQFAYISGVRTDDETLPLMRRRRRYGGSAARWGFAIYLASKDGCAGDPTDWT